MFKQQSKSASDLYKLQQRRLDLKQMLVAEKNRKAAPGIDIIKNSCELVIEAVEKEVKKITHRINELIASDYVLRQRKGALKTIEGIGDVIANELCTSQDLILQTL